MSVTGEPDWGVFGSPLRDGKTWSASVCSIAVMQLLGLGTGEPFLRVLGSPLREGKAGCVYGWYNGGAAYGWPCR